MNETASPGRLRRTLRRYWLPILCLWVLVSAPLITWARGATRPQYRAASLIRLDPRVDHLYGSPAGERDLADASLQTIVQLITSANVLTSAGTNPEVARQERIRTAGDVVAELRKAIRVVVLPGTYLVEVSMTSPSGVEAAAVVNAVVGAFNETNAEWADGMTRNRIHSLETYLAELNSKSSELERRWKDLVSQRELAEKLRPSSLVNGSHRARLEQRLIDSELDRLRATAELDSLPDGAARNPARVDELELRIRAAKVFEKMLRARLDSSDPGLARRSAADDVDIELIRRQIDDLRAMRDAVARKLEQIKFDARHEPRVKVVHRAIAPGRPSGPNLRPWAFGAIACLTFLTVLGLFSGIEARSGGPRRTTPSVPPGPPTVA